MDPLTERTRATIRDPIIGAVDIGGTKIAVGIMDGSGHILARAASPLDRTAGYPAAIDTITRQLRELETRTATRIIGIGVGSTGPVFPLTGAFGDVNFFPEWCNRNPVRDLSSSFGLDVAIENDADAGALAEYRWGAGAGKTRVLYVSVGTGIGVGFVVDGKLYRGAGYSHPEIGHHLIDPAGPACACGLSGCWESLAAGPAIVNWFKSANPDSPRDGSPLTTELIFERARAGDQWAMRAVARHATYLGRGLANLVTLFVPDAIILGGGVMNNGDLVINSVRDLVASTCKLVPHQYTTITLARLGDDCNLIGAGQVWHHQFRNPRLT